MVKQDAQTFLRRQFPAPRCPTHVVVCICGVYEHSVIHTMSAWIQNEDLQPCINGLQLHWALLPVPEIRNDLYFNLCSLCVFHFVVTISIQELINSQATCDARTWHACTTPQMGCYRLSMPATLQSILLVTLALCYRICILLSMAATEVNKMKTRTFSWMKQYKW